MNSENQIWGPNLELVIESFFTGKSKGGSALGESKALFKASTFFFF